MAVMWQPGAATATGAVPVLLELSRPPVPAVLAAHDRSVYVESVEQPPSGYVLARRWMRNDPDMDVECIPQQQSSLALPRPEPASAAPTAAAGDTDGAPVFPDDSDDYNPEESVKRLKQHWVGVRRYDNSQRMQRLERCRERLNMLSSLTMHPVAQLLTVQQQAATAHLLPPVLAPEQQQEGAVTQQPPAPQHSALAVTALASEQQQLEEQQQPLQPQQQPPEQQQQQQQAQADAAQVPPAIAAADHHAAA